MNLKQKIELLNDIRRFKTSFQESNDFKEFLADCKLYLNPSGYGIRIENKWITLNGYEKIHRNIGRGDYKDEDSYVEFKVSYKSNDKYTFLQFRPFQSIDRYDLMLIDYNMNYSLFQIPKDDMMSIIEDSNHVCHGTKEHNTLNENLEYRITLTDNHLPKLTKFLNKDVKSKYTTSFW